MQKFEIIREHGGIAFKNNIEGRYVFFQPGDDAGFFERELQDFTEGFGEETALAMLWVSYEAVADEEF